MKPPELSPNDLMQLFAGACDPPRSAKPGSRNRWPQCRAVTKKKASRGRLPGRCRATGGGIAGLCHFHGGLSLGPAIGWKRGQEPYKPRQLVLFSGHEDFLRELHDKPNQQRRWQMMAIPLDLLEVIGLSEFMVGGMDVDVVRAALEERGIRRRTVSCWPQELGFRAVKLLAERGRIAFGLFHSRRDVFRGARARVGRTIVSREPVKVGPQELLAALSAAGSKPRRVL